MTKNRFVSKIENSAGATLREIELKEDEDGIDVLINGYSVVGFQHKKNRIIIYSGASEAAGLEGDSKERCLFINEE